MTVHAITYSRRPSALAYMLRAFQPSSGWHSRREFADLCLTWKGFRIESDAVDSLKLIAGIEDGGVKARLLLLVPHVSGFRLLMAMLTHPMWPLPIWRALQVRNHLVLHQSIRIGDVFDATTQVSGWRVLEKGIEVDLHTRLQRGATTAWESVVTFYYRGRYGSATERGATLGASQTAPVVADQAEHVARWRVGAVKQWHFGALTGDYNGIHQWNWYARGMGFPAAFAHPQRVAAQCLARLPPTYSAPQRLDLWIKGPIFFGSEVVQRRNVSPSGSSQDFALWLADDPRPALVGHSSEGMDRLKAQHS